MITQFSTEQQQSHLVQFALLVPLFRTSPLHQRIWKHWVKICGRLVALVPPSEQLEQISSSFLIPMATTFMRVGRYRRNIGDRISGTDHVNRSNGCWCGSLSSYWL